MNQLAETYPATNKGNGATLTRLKPNLVRDVQSVLLLLLGAVGFVLLIACVNVSNLMLARSTGRAREFRNSCGPRRSTMAPSSSIVGGELVALALRWNCRLAYCHLGHPGCTKSFADTLPRAQEVAVDTRVLLFTVLITVLTGILSGLLPALKASQWRFNDNPKRGWTWRKLC
jgi:hypothetical protein